MKGGGGEVRVCGEGRSNFRAESRVACGRVRAERDKTSLPGGFGFVSLFHTRRGSEKETRGAC